MNVITTVAVTPSAPPSIPATATPLSSRPISPLHHVIVVENAESQATPSSRPAKSEASKPAPSRRQLAWVAMVASTKAASCWFFGRSVGKCVEVTLCHNAHPAVAMVSGAAASAIGATFCAASARGLASTPSPSKSLAAIVAAVSGALLGALPVAMAYMDGSAPRAGATQAGVIIGRAVTAAATVALDAAGPHLVIPDDGGQIKAHLLEAIIISLATGAVASTAAFGGAAIYPALDEGGACNEDESLQATMARTFAADVLLPVVIASVVTPIAVLIMSKRPGTTYESSGKAAVPGLLPAANHAGRATVTDSILRVMTTALSTSGAMPHVVKGVVYSAGVASAELLSSFASATVRGLKWNGQHSYALHTPEAVRMDRLETIG